MASVFKRGGRTNRHGYWYASWYDHAGKRHSKCTKTTDKATAERIANKHEADAALRREGVIDATMDAIAQQSRRSIESHLEDYKAKLKAAKNTAGHVTETLVKIRKICDHAKFGAAADITADGVNRFTTYWLETGNSSRSAQAYITAIKGFTSWLVKTDKLSRNPLASVRAPNPTSDRRHERRMLLPKEWLWLRDATANGPDRGGVSGRERSLLYATAIQTGLRSMELRSLTRGSLFLDGDSPYLVCKAGSTKNRKDAKQYLLPELAAELASSIATKSPKASAFRMASKFNMAKVLRDDLAQARREWLEAAKNDPQERLRREQNDFLCEANHEGEHLDFHSLRHTCGAWLAMKGAHPKTVQVVMRHSSITLTMDTYGHLFPGQAAEAIQQIGPFFKGADDAEAGQVRATGTMGDMTLRDFGAQRQAQQSGRDLVREDATSNEKPSTTLDFIERLNVLDIGTLDDTVPDRATPSGNEAAGARTQDLRIKSPLLYRLSYSLESVSI